MLHFTTPRFNPFEKDLHKIRVTDLDKLVQSAVPGGWYVQYFGAFPDEPELARATASFANSDGGWIIIGVIADEAGAAAAIPGFDRSVAHRPNEKVRDMILRSVSPLPPFESRLIKLTDTQGVLIINVERGEDTPYLTGSGTIYRRSNSGAEPVAETDRYALARLAERPEIMRQRIEGFSFNPFPAADSQCVLEAYFYTLPVNKYRVDGFMNKAFIKALRKKFGVITDALPGYMDFDNYSTSHSSYILRLRPLPQDFTDQAVTLELFHNGSLKLYLPLEGMPVPVPEEDLFEIERQFRHLTAFENHLGRAQAARLRVIDGYKLLVSFTVLVEQYLSLLRQKGYVNPLKVRFRLANALHTLLFFDNQGYLDYLNEYGPPICFKDQIEIPIFEGGNTYEAAINESPMVFMGILFGAMGLPPAFVPTAMRGLERYLNGLQVKSRLSAKVLSLFDS